MKQKPMNLNINLSGAAVDLFAFTEGRAADVEAARRLDMVLVWEFQLLKLKQMVELHSGQK